MWWMGRLMWESFVKVSRFELGMDFSELDVPVDPLGVVRMIKHQLGDVGILIHLDQAQVWLQASSHPVVIA